MKFGLAISLLIASVLASVNYTSVEMGARVARTLVKRESLADVSALDSKTGTPVEFTEYYVDAFEDGTPYFVIVTMSSTEKNTEFTKSKGLKSSLNIRVGNHQLWDKTYQNQYTEYPFPPDSFTDPSLYSYPRVSFTGEFKVLEPDSDTKKKLEEKYKERHPDGKLWFPGAWYSFHKANWMMFDIESIYMLGGYGGSSYIGDIPVEVYKNASAFDDLSEIKK